MDRNKISKESYDMFFWINVQKLNNQTLLVESYFKQNNIKLING